jgi:TPP-dependent 2-oxoacid decarboxylase
MTKQKIADYICQRIEKAGVSHTFGIPGDFILPFYAAQTRSSIKTVVMTHEPSVGYAADAYARLRGLGVALVTYGAGGLNMVNPVGLAYAEQSPLLVISGAPETRFRNDKPLLHHCVKDFKTQHDVFVQVTESATIIDNATSAQSELDRVFDTTMGKSRPGYVELCRDMVNTEIDTADRPAPQQTAAEEARRLIFESTLAEAVQEISDKLKKSKQPVLLVGVEVRRFGLKDMIVELATALNLPVVTSILGKSAFPESHPNFIGNYFGQFANPAVKEYVEGADCILALGAVMTEMETGGYTAKFDHGNLIAVTESEVHVGHHQYHGLNLRSVISEILQGCAGKNSTAARFTIPSIAAELIEADPAAKHLTVASMIGSLNDLLTGPRGADFSIVTDTGDCMYAGMSLKTDVFLAPGYYVSMGFGVPAAIGAQLAMPQRRPIVLVGDGAFQMTGLEISTAVKEKLNPVIIVFNNASYAMLRFIDQQRDYFDLPRWDYVGLAKSVGAGGMRAESGKDFAAALAKAAASDGPFLIDAVLAADDISPTLRRLTDHFGKKVKAAIV